MEYGHPVIQALFTAGISFCLGWYLCKKSASAKSVSKICQSVTGDLKLVLVVRNDLGMSKGKVAAQCSHATLGCYRNALEDCPQIVSAWELCGEKKIALKAPDYETLNKLQNAAGNAGLPHCLIHDAGHTQVPSGSATVLGIGPVSLTKLLENSNCIKHSKLVKGVCAFPSVQYTPVFTL
uniref:peptidyl-tRNA hydrolase n=1 Tax=Echinococcus granulosus TaxID=6210 RepID=A0A068WWN0_ECHGR|nr:peptidyl tRNA hydrolase 2 mitochondrial [Echinococcus granulosus]